MKVISLNIWGGHVKAPLLEFFSTHQEVEIFCLQEVYYKAKAQITEESRYLALDILSEIKERLPHHVALFKPVVNNIYGIALLVKSEVEILGEGFVPIYQNLSYPGMGPTHSRILQWCECKYKDDIFTVINIHGLWNGQGKKDSPERLLQSQNIRHFISSIETPVIICGDFNLRPDTKSMEILEVGMQNCISQFQIQSTRTSYYTKEERWADYMLLSPEVGIKSFEILPDEVSDHAPLLLDFSLSREASLTK